MSNLKKLLLFSQSLFLIPSVFAVEVPTFSDFISNLGDYLWGWMTNSYSVYFFTFVFFFILLYGIYSAALRFVKIFQENNGLNRSGKLVGVSLSLLSCLAIFFFTKEKGMDAILEDVLAPFGILAGFGIGMLVFGITYFGFKGEDGSRSWKIALAAAGLGMIVVGMITTAPNILSWGFLLAFIAGVGALISAFSGGKESKGSTATSTDIDSLNNEPDSEPNKSGALKKIGENIGGLFKGKKSDETPTEPIKETPPGNEWDCKIKGYHIDSPGEWKIINGNEDNILISADNVTINGGEMLAVEVDAKNTKIKGDAKIKGKEIGVQVNEGASLEISENVEISGEHGIIVESKEFNILGGNITGTEGVGVFVSSGKVTISGGKITGKEKGVYVAGNGEANITGGELTGEVGLMVHFDNDNLDRSLANITGGEIKGQKYGVVSYRINENVISGGIYYMTTKTEGDHSAVWEKGKQEVTSTSEEIKDIKKETIVDDSVIDEEIKEDHSEEIKEIINRYKQQYLSILSEYKKHVISDGAFNVQTEMIKKGFEGELKTIGLTKEKIAEYWEDIISSEKAVDVDSSLEDKKKSTEEEIKKFGDTCPVERISKPIFVKTKGAMIHYSINKEKGIDLNLLKNSLDKLSIAINQFKKNDEFFDKIVKHITINDNALPSLHPNNQLFKKQEKWILQSIGSNHFKNATLIDVHTTCEEIFNGLYKEWNEIMSAIENVAQEIITALPEQKETIGFEGGHFKSDAYPEKILDFKEQLINNQSYNLLEEKLIKWHRDWNNFSFGIWQANRLISDLCEIYTGNSGLTEKQKRTETPIYSIRAIGGEKKLFDKLLDGSKNILTLFSKRKLSDEELKQSNILAKSFNSEKDKMDLLNFLFQDKLEGKTGHQILHDKNMIKHLAEDADYVDLSTKEVDLLKKIYKQLK